MWGLEEGVWEGAGLKGGSGRGGVWGGSQGKDETWGSSLVTFERTPVLFGGWGGLWGVGVHLGGSLWLVGWFWGHRGGGRLMGEGFRLSEEPYGVCGVPRVVLGCQQSPVRRVCLGGVVLRGVLGS